MSTVYSAGVPGVKRHGICTRDTQRYESHILMSFTTVYRIVRCTATVSSGEQAGGWTVDRFAEKCLRDWQQAGGYDANMLMRGTWSRNVAVVFIGSSRPRWFQRVSCGRRADCGGSGVDRRA